MNPRLTRLHPYPFQKLAELKAGVTPPADLDHIALSVGEPRHPTPAFIGEAVTAHLGELGDYPATRGTGVLREAIVDWLTKRFDLGATLDPQRHIIPVYGTREALFAFAQAVVEPRNALVLMPNPFYQIYEGAALLAGAQPYYLNTTEANGYLPDLEAVDADTWRRCQLIYLCTPGNPAGAVMDNAMLQRLIELADRHDFIIASDECYSEIYPDEDAPPTGLLAAAKQAGRDDYRRCVVFHSLSKRSNAPGLRSGFVAGDADVLRAFLHYRTYHGCAVSLPYQAASVLAWQDEAHVRENRALYRQKFAAVLDILAPVMHVSAPQAGFYLWPETPIDDEAFARGLYAAQNVSVLPGSYLSRDAGGINPGRNRVRLALVAEVEACIDAAGRIRDYLAAL